MSMRAPAFLVSVALLVSVPVAAQQQNTLDTLDVAHKVVVGTNALRRQDGQRQVAGNAQLTNAALEFARFLSRSDEISHTADGRRPEERAKQHGYDYCIVSENLAQRYNSEGFSVDELVQGFLQGWERSPGHRKNMHNPEVTEIGVAVVRNENSGHYYAVQMFGRPQSDMIVFEMTNSSTTAIPYALGNRTYSLLPGYTRTHRECGAVKFEIQWPDDQPPITVAPGNGDRLAIVGDAAGKLRLKRELVSDSRTK